MDKQSEYSSLRDEMLNLDNKKSNYILALYTITIFIFAIESNKSIFFLLPYIVLFPFQRQILSIRDGCIRIAAYIAVYLEEGEGWESNYEEILEYTRIKSNNYVNSKMIDVLTGRVAVSQIGFICSSACVIMCLYNIIIKKDNIIFNTIYIFCGIILYVLVKLLCKNAMNTMVTRKTYIDNLKKHKKQCDETEYTMKEYEDLLHIVNQKVHVHKNDNPKS